MSRSCLCTAESVSVCHPWAIFHDRCILRCKVKRHICFLSTAIACILFIIKHKLFFMCQYPMMPNTVSTQHIISGYTHLFDADVPRYHLPWNSEGRGVMVGAREALCNCPCLSCGFKPCLKQVFREISCSSLFNVRTLF